MIAAGVAGIAPPCLAAAPDPATVQYEASPVISEDGIAAIAMSMTFAGDADGETAIELPTSWAGSDRLYEHIAKLSVTGASLSQGVPQPSLILRHAPRAMVRVQWQVTAANSADPGPDYEKAKPVIRPGWFYVHGNGAFIIPTGNPDRPARFAWGRVPSSLTVASDIDFVSQTSLTTDKITGSILIGGRDVRIVEKRVNSVPVRFAVRGTWTFSDQQLLDALSATFSAYNQYLTAKAVPYFVSLIPLTGGDTGALSMGGSGRFGGFALAATTNTTRDDFIRLLGHEYGHRWFGGDFGPVAQPDGAEYWFTEGFNDYVTNKVLVRAGLWTIEDYARGLRDVTLRYASSSVRGAPYQALIDQFWSNPDSAQAVYDRGHLTALVAANAAADKTRFRKSVQAMANRPGQFPKTQTQSQRFASRFGDAGTLAFVGAIASGAAIVIPPALLAECGRFEWQDQPVFATGYTTSIENGIRRIATVSPDSPAWAAGLRPGMTYVKRISVAFGDATVPIVLRVADAAGERDLRWLPAGAATVRYQALIIDPPQSREACRRAIMR